MHANISFACAALLLAGCAGGYYPDGGYGPVAPVTPGPDNAPPAHPLARSVAYVCEDLTRVTLTQGQPNARATLNSGLDLNLAGMGLNRWGAPPYEFRALGGEAHWINQGRVYRCRLG